MKKVQAQLKTVAKTLASLAAKLEKLNAQIGAAPAPKKAAKAAPKKKKAAAKKTPAAKKAPAAKAEAGDKDTVLDKVLDVIKKSRTGATIANLKSKTSLESRQLSNALYKLSKKGKIKSKSRGVYIKA
jgi:predicted Rossmann fold nucleotide-binding protein DprA/Smf involved in DNA uptake